MTAEIRKAAVLGAGTMGSRIAAHLANAGVEVLLLDMPLPDGKTPRARKSIVESALKAVQKAKPPAFFTDSTVRRISWGNFEDDLGRLAEADWIIEAIIEKFEPKRDLLARVDEVRRPGSLVSSNTSGLPIASLAEGRSEDFRRHWMGTHFFNPPRHMRLLEMIPTPETGPQATRFLENFCDRRLGKVVVYANDRPNFIANRIFLFSVMHTVKTMREQGLTVEQVDALTGPLVGRPRMATFRLADFTGVDVCVYVAGNLYRLVPEDKKRDVYQPPEFLKKMVDSGMLGDKAGKGFYRKDSKAPGGRLVLDLDTLEYREMRPPHWPAVEKASKIPGLGERIRTLIANGDAPGRFLWETLSELFLYAAARIPEVTGDIVSVDTTMTAGFNWQRGIFEIWNSLGVEPTAERMKKEGKTLPPLVEAVLASPEKAFYRQRGAERSYFDLPSRELKPIVEKPGILRLDAIKGKRKPVESNAGASLWDMGEGVALLEFHSKANTLDQDVLEMIQRALASVEKSFEALVIGNEGDRFSAGVNLMMLLGLAKQGDWKAVEQAVENVQQLMRAVRRSKKPVVAAVHGQTLAGGCEIAMHCDAVQAAAETYMGLVEVGVGLIPAAGGSTGLLRRHTGGLTPKDDVTAPARTVFQTIGMAKVSNSAAEAREWRYLTPQDGITMNRDRLLGEAKDRARALALAGYEPPEPKEILVGGRGTLAALKVTLWILREGAHIGEYDAVVGEKLARVLSGGELTEPGYVSEDYLLGMEREAFVSLCGEQRTQQRLEHMLKTGKPLRN